MVKKEIGKRLKIFRKYIRQDSVPFAKEMNVASTTYSKYENGHTIFDATFLKALIEKYSCNPIWILTGEGHLTIDNSYELLGSINETNVNYTKKGSIIEQLLQEKDNLIDEKDKIIKLLESEIKRLK